MDEQVPNSIPSDEQVRRQRTADLTYSFGSRDVQEAPQDYLPFVPTITPTEALEDLASPQTAYALIPEAKTPHADGRVSPFARLQHHSKIESVQSVRQSLARLANEDRLTAQTTYPCRLLLAWRATRFFATACSLVQAASFLVDTLYDPSAWYSPPQTQPTTPAWRRHSRQALLAVRSLTEHELPLHPGNLPLQKRQQHAQAFSHTAEALGFNKGSSPLPFLGRYGVFGLDDPHLTHLLWPSPEEIIGFEEAIINKTITMLVEEGVVHTRSEVTEQFGLDYAEAICLTMMAQEVIRLTSPYADPATAKATVLAQIDNYQKRARESLQFRDELNAIKQRSSILGLLKQNTDDQDNKAFIDAIEEAQEERKQIASRTTDHIDSPSSHNHQHGHLGND